MALKAVLVGVKTEVVFYQQHKAIHGAISSHGANTYGVTLSEIETEIKTLSESEEKYAVHSNAMRVMQIIQNYKISNHSKKLAQIDISVDGDDEDEWKLFYQSKMDIIMAVHRFILQFDVQFDVYPASWMPYPVGKVLVHRQPSTLSMLLQTLCCRTGQIRQR